MNTILKELTPKQRRFVTRTIETLNPTQAVKEVYNLGNLGGDPKKRDITASSIGSENLKKPKIRLAFEEALKELDDTQYLRELHDLALSKDDKRAKLQAIDMLMKLKDKYPAGKLKLTQQNEQREQYLDTEVK